MSSVPSVRACGHSSVDTLEPNVCDVDTLEPNVCEGAHERRRVLRLCPLLPRRGAGKHSQKSPL